MYSYPNQSYINRPGCGSQSTPVEPSTLPTFSTNALQDIVEGQQRVTNGLVSLLSQERTSNDRSTRDHKQQLASLTALSQHFLTFMPDVEQKFSALEGSIRNHCPNADNGDLQNRVKDMVEVVANLGRIAEGFACSTGLRLVPGLAPSPWAWVPTDAPPLQQDSTSFSATFPQAPRIFPAAIPNSTRSSVFAHSTGPARSVHWPSDLDAPTTSWTAPWSEPYCTYPYGVGTAPAASSRFSLGGFPSFSAGTGLGTVPMAYPPPPFPYRSPSPSDASSSLTPVIQPHSPAPAPRVPFGPHSSPLSVPIVEPPHLPRTVATPRLTPTPSQTESVVGSIRRLSTITESRTPSPAIPSPPAFGRTPHNGPSPSTSTTETFSTPSGVLVYPPVAPRAGLVTTSRVPDSQLQTWHGMMYPSGPSSTTPSIDGFSIPSPPRVDLPLFPPVDAVRWSSLFPSAPVVVERPPLRDGPSGVTITRVASQDESNVSLMSSPVRSVISYVDSPESGSLSEPMTPLSRTSSEPTSGAVPNRLTTDVVVNPRESDGSAQSTAVTTVPDTAGASASNVPTNTMLPRHHLAIQLVSFFFDSVQRIFKVPTSVDLSYNGFEVSFSTASVPWTDGSAVGMVADEGGENDRAFEIMSTPSNAALHRYIRDLARVRMDLIAIQARENNITDPAIVQLELRIKAEQEATRSWMRRVCAAAGALSIADPAFSPRT